MDNYVKCDHTRGQLDIFLSLNFSLFFVMTAIMPPSPPPFAHLKSRQSRCSLLQIGGVGKTRVRVTPRVRVRVRVTVRVEGEGKGEGGG